MHVHPLIVSWFCFIFVNYHYNTMLDLHTAWVGHILTAFEEPVFEIHAYLFIFISLYVVLLQVSYAFLLVQHMSYQRSSVLQ